MKTLIIGEKYREKLEKHLHFLGFDVFWLPNNTDINIKLSGHSDLSVFIHERNAILAPYLKGSELVNSLTNGGYNVIISTEKQSELYPGDVNLCASLINNKILHCSKYTDKAILDLQLDSIDVKQGYTRCSCLIFGNCVITSDKGIASALKRNNIEILLINNEGIVLEGYDRGFIGGASFVCDNTVYFVGDINKHPDGKLITDFIMTHNYKIACVSDGDLFDIGGAVVIS